MDNVVLQCPACREPARGASGSHALDEAFVCTGCAHAWPNLGGVPYLLMDPAPLAQAQRLLATWPAWPQDAVDQPALTSLAIWAQAGWGSWAQPPLPQASLDWLPDWLDALPPGPVLVAGCATGAELRHLPADRSVWALDAAPLSVGWARLLADRDLALPWRRDALRLDVRPLQLSPSSRSVLQRARWVIADAANPPFLPESFAAIVMLNLLDAVDEPLVLLGQTEALLRPGGVLVTASPYHFQPAVTPGAHQLLRWLPPDLPLHEGMAHLATGRAIPGFLDSLTLVRSASDVPWRVASHPSFSADYRLHIMRLHKNS